MTQDLVNSLVSQVEKYIHGPAREQIITQIEQNPTADTLAEITYSTIIGIDQQSVERGSPVDIDVLMGVATETIDLLVEIMEAMGVQMNPDEIREETLLKIVMLHMQAVENDPEEKAAAEQLLATLAEDGTLEQSMQYIEQRAGSSQEEMAAAGQQMAAPQQTPVAAGVRQGLMQSGVT